MINQAISIENNFSVKTLEEQVREFLVGKVLRLAEVLRADGRVGIRHRYDKIISSVSLTDTAYLKIELQGQQEVEFFQVIKLKKSEAGWSRYLEVTSIDGITLICI